jgi:hypothetical protein
MTTWIVTIGSSDVQLSCTKTKWVQTFKALNSDQILPTKVGESSQTEDEEPRLQVPSRVLGMAYSEGNSDADLVFPLLAPTVDYLDQNRIRPDQVVVLLTDQSNIFTEADRELKESPFWQDTSTLEFLLKRYFKKRLPKAAFIPLYLRPNIGKPGIDHWNETLALVDNVFNEVTVRSGKTVYISHQAGTPAVSSAVQFASLARFGQNAIFLAINRLDPVEPVEKISSSAYLKGIKKQEARRLVMDGLPGAAVNLLENIGEPIPQPLHELVEFFNLNNPVISTGNDYSIETISQRLSDALDLVGIYFRQRNYIQGVTILASCHEVFLKAALLKLLQNQELEVQGKSVLASKVFVLEAMGLGFINDIKLQKEFLVSDINFFKIEILGKLKYPNLDKFKSELDKSYASKVNNWMVDEWIERLYPEFKNMRWPMLEWVCKYYRDQGHDLRNQLLHNLRGTESSDVISYLIGLRKDIDPESSSVIDIYKKHVREAMINSMQKLALPYDSENLTKKLKRIASLI